jgi:hypothetical protein
MQEVQPDLPAVALFIFKRPDVTAQTFARIRAARPGLLLLVADAPRPHVEGEAALCQQTRAVVEAVDWPCTVLRNYADVNLGCGRRLSSGLDWVFEQVEEAIILEDDCLPDPTFFTFCAEMLARYRDDARVMMVSGGNFLEGRRFSDDSYYFSRNSHIWGWAAWRRAWRLYDFNMTQWPVLRQRQWLKSVLPDRFLVAQWQRTFDLVAAGKIDTWDFQWSFCVWANNGLSITPNISLVSNIGFGHAHATYSVENNPNVIKAQSMSYPLRHPQSVAACEKADDYEFKHIMIKPYTRYKMFCKQILKYFRFSKKRDRG